jgi:hypothetical protein
VETSFWWRKSTRLALIPLISLLFSNGVRSTTSLTGFFILKTKFLLLLRSLHIFVCCCPAQSSQRCIGGKGYPWRMRDCPSPTPPFMPLFGPPAIRYCLTPSHHLMAAEGHDSLPPPCRLSLEWEQLSHRSLISLINLK